MCVVFFKQKTAYDVRISDLSSDVCASDSGRKHLDLPAAELRLLGGELDDHGDARLQTGLPAPRDLHPMLIGSAIETHRMEVLLQRAVGLGDRKSTRLNSSH